MTFDKLQFPLILVGLVVAVAVFAFLFFVRAPYGRHIRRGWGPLIPNHFAWIIMEMPAVVVFAWCFAAGTAPRNLPILLFFALWELHYVHRALIYPWTIRDGRKKMPIAVMLLGFGFTPGQHLCQRTLSVHAIRRLPAKLAARCALSSWSDLVHGGIYHQQLGRSGFACTA